MFDSILDFALVSVCIKYRFEETVYGQIVAQPVFEVYLECLQVHSEV